MQYSFSCTFSYKGSSPNPFYTSCMVCPSPCLFPTSTGYTRASKNRLCEFVFAKFSTMDHVIHVNSSIVPETGVILALSLGSTLELYLYNNILRHCNFIYPINYPINFVNFTLEISLCALTSFFRCSLRSTRKRGSARGFLETVVSFPLFLLLFPKITLTLYSRYSVLKHQYI